MVMVLWSCWFSSVGVLRSCWFFFLGIGSALFLVGFEGPVALCGWFNAPYALLVLVMAVLVVCLRLFRLFVVL